MVNYNDANLERVYCLFTVKYAFGLAYFYVNLFGILSTTEVIMRIVYIVVQLCTHKNT